MDLHLKDKVAVITGASRGLGAATAAVLAAEGAKLVLSARDRDALSEQTKSLGDTYGVAIETVAADLTKSEDADAVAKAALSAFGRIDILVNSAGASQGGLFWELPDQVWLDSMDLKVMGTVRMTRAVIPAMLKQKYGRIVNIIGNTGLQPSPRLLPGASANAALLAITKGLGEELAPHGVVINALNPGPTRTERWTNLMAKLAESSGRTVAEVEADYTDQIPMDRLGEPEEIGRLAAFLASDVAANMTGASMTADGGWTKGLG